MCFLVFFSVDFKVSGAQRDNNDDMNLSAPITVEEIFCLMTNYIQLICTSCLVHVANDADEVSMNLMNIISHQHVSW